MEISVLGLVDNTMVVENLQHTATPGVGLPYCTQAGHVDHNLSFNPKFLVGRFFLQTTRTDTHESPGRRKSHSRGGCLHEAVFVEQKCYSCT